ncbi:unnamed protein product [Moneuplotes crassus]|uniref:Uncharacterized protein n=1 Tax=Euplotes crassus TaxID=5936 RepID=A0AAD1X7V2_EUPCR|nr:unnamed protein product [Moneuplotes crassus]
MCNFIGSHNKFWIESRRQKIEEIVNKKPLNTTFTGLPLSEPNSPSRKDGFLNDLWSCTPSDCSDEERYRESMSERLNYRLKLETEKLYYHLSKNKICVVPSQEYQQDFSSRPYFSIILKDMKFTKAKQEEANLKRQMKKESEIKKQEDLSRSLTRGATLGMYSFFSIGLILLLGSKNYMTQGDIQREIEFSKKVGRIKRDGRKRNFLEDEFKNIHKRIPFLKISGSVDYKRNKRPKKIEEVNFEKKIKEEYDRRNQAKLLLQEALFSKFTMKNANDRTSYKNIGQLPDFTIDDNAKPKDPGFKKNQSHRTKKDPANKDLIDALKAKKQFSASNKKKITKMLKSTIEKKINNSVLQNEFKKLRVNLELNILKDRENKKLLDVLLPRKRHNSNIKRVLEKSKNMLKRKYMHRVNACEKK